jgi:hypothetical protein
LKRSGITISITKYYFAASLIQILEYYIFRLSFSTVQKKTETIQNFKFPLFLNQLENTIGFFGYYRKFVEHYTAFSKSLMELKTKDIKNALIKDYKRENITFHIFIKLIIIPKEFLLYEIIFENLK